MGRNTGGLHGFTRDGLGADVMPTYIVSFHIHEMGQLLSHQLGFKSLVGITGFLPSCLVTHIPSLSISFFICKMGAMKITTRPRATEMVQRFRAQAALVEDTGSVPSAPVTAYEHLELQFQGI